MTREEAIQVLRDWDGYFIGHSSDDVNEALNIAIKALEQEPCEIIKEIPKDYKYDTETEDFLVYRHMYTGHEIHIEKPVPKYKLEQEPCEDEYIKVPKKALKYRTAGMVAYNAEWLKNHFDIERAVICGEQQPCGDAISRQAYIERYRKWAYSEYGRITGNDALAIRVAMSLPPVTPQQKVGHWIAIDEEPHEDYECDKCGYTISTYTANIEPHMEYKYCPNCGAKMEVE